LQVGDPTLAGWLIFATYFLLVCRFVWKARISYQQGGSYKLWLLMAAFFLLLGINKQLDLQTWCVQSLKALSIQHGWYEQRKGLQIAFIVAFGTAMLLTMISLKLFLLSIWHRYKLVWLGLLLLFGFIFLRAASFQHLDVVAVGTIMGIQWYVILEMIALLTILAGTYVKQNVSDYKMTKLSEINPIVQIDKEGDAARCPQCGKQAVATTVHNRKFKCRRCGFFYKVHVSGHDDT